ETDNDQGTLEHDYQTGLEQVVGFVRERGIDAPFYIARTSYFPFNNDHPLGIDQGIRRAQNAVIQSGLGTREGPDTDALNLAYYRFDAVHFSARGLDVLAEK